MLDKAWLCHIKNILDGKTTPIICDAIAGRIPIKKRERLLMDSPFEAVDGGVSEIALNLSVELKDYLKGVTRERQRMESFDEAVEIDRMIENIKKVALNWDHYSEIFNEKKPDLKRALSHSPTAGRERDLLKLGLILLESAKSGNREILGEFINNNFPLNFQHPVTGRTALHTAMAFKSGAYALDLLATRQCNYLLRANDGCLAAEDLYAGIGQSWGDKLDFSDAVAVHELTKETIKQAAEKGLNLDTLFKDAIEDPLAEPKDLG